MNLTSPAVVSALLRRHGVRLRKALGQNFLVDGNILRKILDAAELPPDACVLEVGAGIGALTHELSQHAARVLVVELDRSLQPILQETLAEADNVHIEYGDVLKVDLPAILAAHCRLPCDVVANIPYQITSPLLARLLENKRFFRRLVLMVQKEVAQRLLASPGSSEYGSMSVFVQYHAAIRLVAYVSRNSFLPPPAVDSAVICLEPLPQPPQPVADEKLFFSVVHAAFGARRKTLLNTLSGGLSLPRDQVSAALACAGIDPRRRGETLSVAEFIALANCIQEVKVKAHNDLP